MIIGLLKNFLFFTKFITKRNREQRDFVRSDQKQAMPSLREACLRHAAPTPTLKVASKGELLYLFSNFLHSRLHLKHNFF